MAVTHGRGSSGGDRGWSSRHQGEPCRSADILTVAGALLSVAAVSVAGDALRARLVRSRAHGGLQHRGRLDGIWIRWGVPGWGLASPLVFAPPMGTALALALGAPRRRLWARMSAGVVLWTTILVAAGALGLEVLRAVR